MEEAWKAVAYDPALPRTHHLSLFLSPTASAWSAHDARTGRCVAFAAGSGDRPPTGPGLPTEPLRTTFLALPELSTLVPEGALAPGLERQVLELVHGPLPAGEPREEPVAEIAARCLYLPGEAAVRTTLAGHPEAHPLPMQALLVRAALARATAQPLLLVHRDDRRVDLVVVRDGQVRLSNAFHAPEPTDVLYFALLAAERTELAPHATRLLMAGPRLSADERTLLHTYFGTCAPAPPGASTPALGVAMSERWLALFDQWACAS